MASILAIVLIIAVLAIIFIFLACLVFKKDDAGGIILKPWNTIYGAADKSEGEDKNLRAVLIISAVIFLASGFLSYLNLYSKERNDFLKQIDFPAIKELNSVFVAEGRISGYVKYSKGRAGFYFSFDSLKVINEKQKTAAGTLPGRIEKEFGFEHEVFVAVKNPSNLQLERDDFISFSFELPDRKDHGYITTYSERIKKISPGNKFLEIFKLRRRFYECISGIFHNSLNSEHAAISDALILGNQSGLPGRVVDDFKKSGIYHLLSISGLHISFFILIVYRFIGFIFSRAFRKTGKNHKVRYLMPAIIVFLLFLYNFIVGQKASMMRATLMSVFILCANSWAKDYDRKYILSITFVLLLIFNPGFFLEAGFWLSFASLFAIIYLNGPLKVMLRTAGKKIREAVFCRHDTQIPESGYFFELLVTSFSVNLCIFPLLTFLFGEFSFLSFFTNIAAIPLSYVLLFVLISSAISGLFWPALGMVLAGPAKILIILLLKISRVWKSMDFAIVQIKGFGVIEMVAYYFFLTCTFLLIFKFATEGPISKK